MIPITVATYLDEQTTKRFLKLVFLILCDYNRVNKIINLCPIMHSSHCNCVRNKTNKLTITLIFT